VDLEVTRLIVLHLAEDDQCNGSGHEKHTLRAIEVLQGYVEKALFPN